MKYQKIKTSILAGSVQIAEDGKATFQANIKFEIIPEIEGKIIPDNYKTPELTFFGLEFNSLNDAASSVIQEQKGLAKLIEVYGCANIIQ